MKGLNLNKGCLLRLQRTQCKGLRDVMESKIATLATGGTGKEYLRLLGDVSLKGTPHETLGAIWDAYSTLSTMSNNKNGRMFEFAICETMVQFGVGPLYFQSTFYGLPHDKYDIAAWTQDGHPIIVSCKTSLRERWKQAELEGRILKLRYIGAESYLVMLDRVGGTRIRNRVNSGEANGLDRIYLADNPEYDDFVEHMLTVGLMDVEPILPIDGKKFGP